MIDNISKRLNKLSPQQRELLSLKASSIKQNLIPRRDKNCDSIPLSFAQSRMWFLTQMSPGNPFYNEPLLAIEIGGPLNVDILQKAFNEIVKRQASLRTVFVVKQHIPTQVVLPWQEIKIIKIDLSALTEAEKVTKVNEIFHNTSRMSFNFEKGPLFSVQLLLLSPEKYIFLFEIHHIVSDGWSLHIFLKEMIECYYNIENDIPIDLPHLRIQYTDYTLWQHERLSGEYFKKLIYFWKTTLGDNVEYLKLPYDYERPENQSFRGGSESVYLDLELTESITNFCKNNQCTLYPFLFSVYVIFLNYLTAKNLFYIGTPVANRDHTDIENLIGFFVNTLIINVKIDREMTFYDHLQRTKQSIINVFNHAELPFDKVIEILHPERELISSPLINVLFVLHNYPIKVPTISGLSLKRIEVKNQFSKFDFVLVASENTENKKLLLEIMYDINLFSSSTIKNCIDQYITILKSCMNDTTASIAKIQLLSSSMHTVKNEEELLKKFNKVRS